VRGCRKNRSLEVRKLRSYEGEKGYGKNSLNSISMHPGFLACQLSSPLALTFILLPVFTLNPEP
jgi:hypothetical protein